MTLLYITFFFRLPSTLRKLIDKLRESGKVNSITKENGNLESRKIKAPFMEIVRSWVNEKTSVIRTWHGIHMAVTIFIVICAIFFPPCNSRDFD